MSDNKFSWETGNDDDDRYVRFYKKLNGEGGSADENDAYKLATRLEAGGMVCHNNNYYGSGGSTQCSIKNSVSESSSAIDSTHEENDSMKVPPNTVALIRHRIAGNNQYINLDSMKTMTTANDVLDNNTRTNLPVYNFTNADTETNFRQALWAPIMHREYIKFNCCLGNITDANVCEKWDPTDVDNIGNCQPYLKDYCQKNKLPYVKSPYTYADTPIIPKGQGCWMLNLDDQHQNTWEHIDDITDKDACMRKPVEIAKKRMEEVFREKEKDGHNDYDVYNNKDISGYKAPVTFWRDAPLVNDKPGTWNDNTTKTDKRYCGCDPNLVDHLGQKQYDILYKISPTAATTLPADICRVPSCGKQHTSNILWNEGQHTSLKLCTGDNNISIVNCTQNTDMHVLDEAKASGINIEQNCTSEAAMDGSIDRDTSKATTSIPPEEEEEESGLSTVMIMIIVAVVLVVLGGGGIGLAVYFARSHTPSTYSSYYQRPYQRQQYYQQP